MRKNIILLIARHFWTSIFKSKILYTLFGVIIILLFYAAYSGVSYHDQNHFRTEHQEMARQSWEANPDKHPHRMAHFGTFAFRIKYPLSIFDFGIESYTGNAIFLEAHKQNMVNFSDAGFSTGLLRFGELSMGMVLQLILPLIIFFIGYSAIVSDRENGTLKILITQGARWKEILFGRSLGLFAIAFFFVLPFFIITVILLLLEGATTADVWIRLSILTLLYVAFSFVLSFITITVSTNSRSSKSALIKLLGLWLVLVVLLPRTSQALGTYFHPAPTKLEFKALIEEQVLAHGDSHDPNDPYFNHLKDSVLKAHNVASVTALPFNYGGFVMAEGERISAEIYKEQHNQLLQNYRQQNELTRWLALINPYLALKNLSMALCGTDFESYVQFQNQAEDYRYKLAQKMNRLQMDYIAADVSSSEGKKNVVDRNEWKSFADFEHDFMSVGGTLESEAVALISLLLWLALSYFAIIYTSQKAKAI